jgi:hypothetical protein
MTLVEINFKKMTTIFRIDVSDELSLFPPPPSSSSASNFEFRLLAITNFFSN